MAGDIEAFLKLAAERRRQAQGGQAAPAPQAAQAAPRSAPAPEPERRPLASTLKPSVRDAEVVDAVLDDSAPYSGAGSVTQVSRPQKQKSKQKPKAKPTVAPSITQGLKPTVVAPVASYAASQSSKSTNTTETSRDSEAALADRVIQMFKSPSSISSAIILSEILKPLDLDRED